MRQQDGARDQPDGLEALFAAGRASAPVPDPALMARILQDGLAQQPRPVTPRVSRPLLRRAGVLGQVLAALGGWRALGGMATAAAAGVWLGFAGVDRLGDWAGLYSAAPEATMNLLPEGDVIAFLLDQEG